ncbi:MAG: beta-ketoacyl-[acyl-carrier-protein] synthase family protein [Bacteroidales bacterium]|jgi:3-oxoacyl-[acyl-carrier-protein] synthase-1|nr:beta-ketoacyl-[acyl-carrier-protein] synthase family protein [Bacteroidales bacterium]
MKVFITGMGIITAIGAGADETLSALKSGRSGIGGIRRFDTVHRHIPVGEVKQSNEELCDLLKLPTVGRYYSRTALLGLMAARQAMRSSHSVTPVRRVALVNATTTGGMDYHEMHYRKLSSDDIHAQEMELLDCAGGTHLIAETLGITDNVTTVSTACSSSANAILTGVRMIRNGLADKVLAGGSDAITRFTLNGFNTLEILSPTGCRPFDAHRNGLTLGEGAAYVVLEPEKTALPDDVLCVVSGYANVSEAYHQTSSSPDGKGAAMVIRQALSVAALSPDDIDCIHAHGTGTQVNDLSEGRAVETVFRNQIPPLSSAKGCIGHTLAAAGSAGAVVSVLSLGEQLLFPNTGFNHPMPELSFQPNTLLRKATVNHVLSNSFGFGGSNTSLIFSRY